MLRDFSKEEFDIIIQGGQSNSDGTGYGDAESHFEPDERILYLNGDFVITQATEKVVGNMICGNFALSFAAKYIADGRLAEGRKLLIIRAAVGGTGFVDKRWGMSDDLYLRMMEMIKTSLELNSKNKLVGFIWHQGETDSNGEISTDTHYNNLSGLLNSVKKEFDCPNLPFIAGDFVEQWRELFPENSERIITAMKKVCVDCLPAAFVNTDGLKSNMQECGMEDTIHFSRDALNKLGIRYYESFCGIV